MYRLPHPQSVCGGPNPRQTADGHGHRHEDRPADELQDGRGALEGGHARECQPIGAVSVV